MATTAAPKTEPTPEEVAAADVAAATATAEEKAAEEVKAEEPVVFRVFEVVRSFTGHHLTQLLHWEKGDTIDGPAGESLYAKGAPIKPVG
jgi:hypothetical protein